MMQILMADRGREDLYPVASAFNGAALYPLKLLQEPPISQEDMKQGRRKKIRYDIGEDAQRCEHVGFHMSIPSQMYVNRKWDLHVSPENPAGPRGDHAASALDHYLSFPPIFCWLFVQRVSSFLMMAFTSMTLTIHVFLPFLYYLLRNAKFSPPIKVSMPSRSPSLVLLPNLEALHQNRNGVCPSALHMA